MKHVFLFALSVLSLFFFFSCRNSANDSSTAKDAHISSHSKDHDLTAHINLCVSSETVELPTDWSGLTVQLFDDHNAALGIKIVEGSCEAGAPDMKCSGSKWRCSVTCILESGSLLFQKWRATAQLDQAPVKVCSQGMGIVNPTDKSEQ